LLRFRVALLNSAYRVTSKCATDRTHNIPSDHVIVWRQIDDGSLLSRAREAGSGPVVAPDVFDAITDMEVPRSHA